MKSANFGHLTALNEQLAQLGYLAERFFSEDAATSVLKARQFAELLSFETAARTGRYDPRDGDRFAEVLSALRRSRAMPRDVIEIVHAVRQAGNRAAHDFETSISHKEALTALKLCRELGVWFQRAFGDATYKSGAFVPPKDPRDLEVELKADLERMRAELERTQRAAQTTGASVEDQRRAREAAEELAARAEEEREEWEALARAVEQEKSALEAALKARQEASRKAPRQEIDARLQAGHEAASRVGLDESETRFLIDAQLRDAGWTVDSEKLRYAKGARPEFGEAMAIAEWPCEGGSVDYALFDGEICIGVIEAKREKTDVPGVLKQAERYAATIRLPAENLWTPHQAADFDHEAAEKRARVPFAFATNGRPYVKQLRDKSGVWYRDLRKSTNHGDALPAWFTPKDIRAKLAHAEEAKHAFAETGFADEGLRDYQQDAVRAVESAIGDGQRDILVAMATGTGKTRTCLALMYRQLRAKRFRRVLFLVDRKTLGEQTLTAMNNADMDGFYKFSEIYGVAGLETRLPADADRVHVATVQALVNRINSEPDGGSRPSPGTYDLIVVDEAHRGYTLDAELGESELGYRNVDDYLSTYRQVLDYFDATRVALTATPALHTTQIFGEPVYSYSYRQAVIDGWLVDHLPPRRITTALSEAGISFKGGEEVEVVDRRTGEINLAKLEDDLDFDVAQFNKKVYSEQFNAVVCEALAQEIDLNAPGKTLIFAARDDHADTVVRLLKKALEAEHGPIRDDLVMKITGQVDRVEDKIRSFRNDALPKFVVTVDLLTTGVDIPAITNLVFLRRVNSRILYDQMLGRATRLCPEIGKEHFRIFDAVDLYATLQNFSDMRPVVTRPDIPVSRLIEDLRRAPESDKRRVADQLRVRVRQRLKTLNEPQRERLAAEIGCDPVYLDDTLKGLSPEAMLSWFEDRPRASEILGAKPAGGPGADPIVIAPHDDHVMGVDDYFGENATPEDYITGFERFVKSNMNTVPALIAATQKPRELTRADLKELARLLDEEGYSEARLRVAYGRVRNADIAAHILGFVRQAAIGDPLVPYATRVENAVHRIEASRDWTAGQRRWLRRIGRALKEAPVADPATLEAGAFQLDGGFRRIDAEFDGALAGVLQELNAAIWDSPAA